MKPRRRGFGDVPEVKDAFMGRIGAIVSAFSLSVSLGTPASAQSQSVLEFLAGSDLVSLSNQDQFAAQSYVTGVVDAALAAGTIGLGASTGHARTCLPEHTTQAELYGIVITYITNNAASRAFPAAADVGLALNQAYPCE
jgi:hypothetical protein